MKLLYIQQFIAQNSTLSRRSASELVKNGAVRVNGKKAKLGQKINPEAETVTLQGKKITPNHTAVVYYIVNKPHGYTCTVSDRFAKHTIIELVPKHPPVYPVGRLDKNSTGLIFLTNDGEFTYCLTHPKFKIEKEYRVTAKNRVPNRTFSPEALKSALLKGITLDDGKTKADKVHSIKKISKNSLSVHIVLHSGKKRIIRRMFKALGLMVTALERVRIGSVKLDIPVGKFRKLSKNEIKKLI